MFIFGKIFQSLQARTKKTFFDFLAEICSCAVFFGFGERGEGFFFLFVFGISERKICVKIGSAGVHFYGFFKKNYCESLTAILHKVEDEFNMNMETYSDTLRAKLEDKEAMEKIREKILSAAESLQQCQDRLNEVIWEETHD